MGQEKKQGKYIQAIYAAGTGQVGWCVSAAPAMQHQAHCKALSASSYSLWRSSISIHSHQTFALSTKDPSSVLFCRAHDTWAWTEAKSSTPRYFTCVAWAFGIEAANTDTCESERGQLRSHPSKRSHERSPNHHATRRTAACKILAKLSSFYIQLAKDTSRRRHRPLQKPPTRSTSDLLPSEDQDVGFRV